VARRVVLFDGCCVFCNRGVDFVLRRDRRAHFRFAASQSEPGRRLLAAHGLPERPGSIVLIEEGRAFLGSTAVLRIARGLGLPWSVLAALLLVPRPLRDAAYGLVAARRRSLFGTREACRIPEPEWRDRFL
jgi:predicted DCC family thiol-disulfide oxidoreductase YuxK